jgi:hypothetical protein
MYKTYKNNYKIDSFDEVKGIFTGKVCRLGENPNNLRNLNFDKASFDECFNNKFITANIEHNNCIKVADSVKIWRDDNYLYSEISVADYFKKDEIRYSYLIDKYNKGQLYFSLGGKMLDSELKRNNHEQYYQNVKRFGRAKLKDTVYKFKLDHNVWSYYKKQYLLADHDMSFMTDLRFDSNSYLDYNPYYIISGRPENKIVHNYEKTNPDLYGKVGNKRGRDCPQYKKTKKDYAISHIIHIFVKQMTTTMTPTRQHNDGGNQ